MIIDAARFGKNFKAILNHIGMTQVELHKRTGISTNTMHEWTSAGRVPRSDTLALISKATGVSADSFLKGVVK